MLYIGIGVQTTILFYSIDPILNQRVYLHDYSRQALVKAMT